jgi:hypothetical protein
MTPVSEASAVIPVDSATTPQAPAFDSQDISTWSSEQKQEWSRTGKVTPSKSDSATDKSKTAVPDSAPDKKASADAASDSATDEKKKTAVPDSAPDSKNDKKTSADIASDSATDKTQKPHLKTKDDTEKRITELLDRVKAAEERAEAAERRSTQPEKRETKQPSQAAPEEYKPLDEKEFFAKNQKATYEDFVRAAARHEAQWEAKGLIEKAIAGERQRIQQETASKELKAKVEDANQRYGAEETQKIFPALDKVLNDEQIPYAVKAMLNESDVLIDLLYVLQGDSSEFQKFLGLARSSPGAAIRKIVTTEALVKEQLKTGKASSSTSISATTTPERGEDGKFKPAKEAVEEKPDKEEAPAKEKPRAPKPAQEVGGRGAASEDPAKAAARTGNYSAFEAEMNRKARAALG